MRKLALLAAMIAFACLTLWGADWLTDGHDPQRTGWQNQEKILTTANVKGLKLLWRVKTESVPPANVTGGFGIGRNLFPPLVASKVNTSTGQKEIVLLGTAMTISTQSMGIPGQWFGANTLTTEALLEIVKRCI